MLQLTPPPGGVPALNDDVYARITRKFPGVLPTRPLDGPDSDCKTCNGTKTFRWFTDPRATIMPKAIETPRLGQPTEVDVTYDIGVVPETGDYECPCWLQTRIQAYLLAHNVGKQNARVHWGDAGWVPVETLAAIKEYADNCADWASRGLGLFLHGGYGTGKSLLSTLVLKSFLAAGIVGHWITFNELLAMHMNSWRDEEARHWFETRVRNAQVLVIDDIGKEAAFAPQDTDGKPLPTNWGSIVSRALDSLFRARVQNGLVTIITANMDPDQVSMNYTPALGSLAVEACMPYSFPSSADARKLQVQRTMAEARHGLTRPFTYG